MSALGASGQAGRGGGPGGVGPAGRGQGFCTHDAEETGKRKGTRRVQRPCLPRGSNHPPGSVVFLCSQTTPQRTGQAVAVSSPDAIAPGLRSTSVWPLPPADIPPASAPATPRPQRDEFSKTSRSDLSVSKPVLAIFIQLLNKKEWKIQQIHPLHKLCYDV